MTLAWANEVVKQGKVAFFSHAEDNISSMRLARSLDMIEFARVAAYD